MVAAARACTGNKKVSGGRGSGTLGFDKEGGAASSRRREGRDGRHVADPAMDARATATAPWMNMGKEIRWGSWAGPPCSHRAQVHSSFLLLFFLFLSFISTPLVFSWPTKRILLCMKLGK